MQDVWGNHRQDVIKNQQINRTKQTPVNEKWRAPWNQRENSQNRKTSLEIWQTKTNDEWNSQKL